MATSIACPTSSIRTCASKGCRSGTRGGTRIDYFAPRDGEYDIKARLGRGIDYDIPHFIGEQNLEISVDGEQVQMFTLPATPDEDLNIERQVFRAPGTARPPQHRVDANGDAIPDEAALKRRTLDDNWVIRVPLKAGVHEIRATFLMKTDAVSEGFRKPFLKPYIGTRPDRRARDARRRVAAGARDHGPAQPGRRRGIAEPSPRLRLPPGEGGRRGRLREDDSVDAGAPRVSPAGHRRATSRCCSTSTARAAPTATSTSGIELALQRMLVSPSFLFRTEFAPARRATGGERYRISDLELASRLSFFLWSSIPDDELLDLATQGKLHEPAVLERQTRRMLADPRSQAFTDQLRRPVAVAAPAAGHRARIRFCSPTTATRWRWRFSRKPSCSSTASCARIGRRSIC